MNYDIYEIFQCVFFLLSRCLMWFIDTLWNFEEKKMSIHTSVKYFLNILIPSCKLVLFEDFNFGQFHLEVVIYVKLVIISCHHSHEWTVAQTFLSGKILHGLGFYISVRSHLLFWNIVLNLSMSCIIWCIKIFFYIIIETKVREFLKKIKMLSK